MNVTALLEKAYHLMKSGRYEEASACFNVILESSPNNIRAGTAKGIALRELGRNEESLVFFDKALNYNSINSFVYYNKIIALRNLGRIKEADDCLKIVNFPAVHRKYNFLSGFIVHF